LRQDGLDLGVVEVGDGDHVSSERLSGRRKYRQIEVRAEKCNVQRTRIHTFGLSQRR
jgi:hypothetical protein